MAVPAPPHPQNHVAAIDTIPDIHQGQAFPVQFREPLDALWRDAGVQSCYARGNESALPENLP